MPKTQYASITTKYVIFASEVSKTIFKLFFSILLLGLKLKCEKYVWNIICYLCSVCTYACKLLFATKVNPSHIYATRYCNVQLFELWLPWDPWRRKRVSKAVQAYFFPRNLLMILHTSPLQLQKAVLQKSFLECSTKDWRERRRLAESQGKCIRKAVRVNLMIWHFLSLKIHLQWSV